MTSRLERLETAAEKTAGILAGQHDIKVVIGKTACFNGRTRTLEMPAYDALPVGSADAWRGILDHECAHAVHTDFEQLHRLDRYGPGERPKVHMIWNAFEDLMIEREWVTGWPGSRKHFAVRDAWITDYQGTTGQVTDPAYVTKAGNPIGQFGALVMGLLCLGRGDPISALHPDTRALIEVPAVWAGTQRGITAPDSATAVRAAIEVWTALQQEVPPEPEPQPEQQPGGDGDGDGESGGGDPTEGDGGEEDAAGPGDCEEAGEESERSDEPGEGGPGQGSDAGDEEEEEAEAEGDGDGKDGEDEGEADGGAPGEGAGASGGGSEPGGEAGVGTGAEDGAPGGGVGDCQTTTDRDEIRRRALAGPAVDLNEEARKALIEEFTEAARDPKRVRWTVHPTTAAEDVWQVHDDATEKDLAWEDCEIRDESARVARLLTNQLAAAILASRRSLPVPVEDGGSLNIDALVDVAVRSPRRDVFLDQARRVDRSTFVGLAVDCSGSMWAGDKWRHAVAASWALHRALTAARVPHAIHGYTTGNGSSTRVSNSDVGDGKRWSRLTSTLHHQTFIAAPGYNSNGCGLAYMRPAGGNVDGESILTIAKRTAEDAGDADRVLLIVISDGLPAGADDRPKTVPHLIDSVERIAEAGIEVYALGVRIESPHVFAKFYPNNSGGPRRAPTGHVLLDNAGGLTDSVVRVLGSLIAGGRGRSRRSA